MIIGNGISPFNSRRTSSAFSAEAISLFDKWALLGTPATEPIKVMVNNTIVSLKDTNQWDELDILPMWVSHSQTAALVDWKRVISMATAGTMNFVANDGFTSNGTGRIDLMYNPGDGLATYKFTQNSDSFGVYIATPVGENRVEISAQDGSSEGIDILNNNATVSVKNNIATAQSNGGNLGRRGLMSSIRIASNSWTNRGNGYNIQSGVANRTDASLAVKNIPWMEFCRNVNGTFSAFSTKKHRYSFAGSGLVVASTLNKCIEENWLAPQGLCPTKRITFNGNSFTAGGVYSGRVLLNINDYANLDVNNRGVSGQTTAQMLTDAQTWVFPFTKSFLTKDVYFVWELTNSMATNGSDATATFNELVSYCQALRTAHPLCKIIVATMLPRIGITEANRLTLNTAITSSVAGYWDAVCDVASDLSMGQTGQYSDTTYYDVDGVHPNTTGYNRLADNFITASIQAFL